MLNALGLHISQICSRHNVYEAMQQAAEDVHLVWNWAGCNRHAERLWQLV